MNPDDLQSLARYAHLTQAGHVPAEAFARTFDAHPASEGVAVLRGRGTLAEATATLPGVDTRLQRGLEALLSSSQPGPDALSCLTHLAGVVAHHRRQRITLLVAWGVVVLAAALSVLLTAAPGLPAAVAAVAAAGVPATAAVLTLRGLRSASAAEVVAAHGRLARSLAGTGTRPPDARATVTRVAAALGSRATLPDRDDLEDLSPGAGDALALAAARTTSQRVQAAVTAQLAALACAAAWVALCGAAADRW